MGLCLLASTNATIQSMHAVTFTFTEASRHDFFLNFASKHSWEEIVQTGGHLYQSNFVENMGQNCSKMTTCRDIKSEVEFQWQTSFCSYYLVTGSNSSVPFFLPYFSHKTAKSSKITKNHYYDNESTSPINCEMGNHKGETISILGDYP